MKTRPAMEFCIFVTIVLSAVSATAQSVVAPGATVQKLAGDFKFTEGPVADRAGNTYFTDQPNDRIMQWTPEGTLKVYLQPSGRANGLAFDRKGNLLACADEQNQLWSIGPDMKVTVLVRDYEGRLLNGPNDLWVAPDDGIYFTDPMYKRPYWSRDPAMQQDGQHVYHLSPDRRTLRRVASDLKQPNGIAGTPDGRTLYIADIGAGKTWAFDIQKNGELSGKRLFCELGSDGMTLDTEGNLYLTGKGVTVFDRSGKQIDHIAVEEPWTANVAFGGPDWKTLFITASKGLYSVRTRLSGTHQ